MRILLYGGTFDPPHAGHMNNLRAAVERVCPDEVIVMPAGVPPHKHASTTPAALRLEMCRCFEALTEPKREQDAPKVTLSDWEIRQAEAGVRNYTVLTLEHLRREYPDAALYFTMGSDMLLTFTQWYRWQDILRLAHAVVVSREIGDDAALCEAAKALDPTGERILLAQAESLPMASSDLRRRLAAGQACADALPESVQNVIRREKLYRSEANS